MPAIVVAVAATAAGSFTAAAVGGGILGALAGAAVSTIVGGVLGRILAPSQKQNAQQSLAAQEAGLSTVVRSSVESRKVIYGRRKVSGTLVFVHTTQQGFASQANLSSYAPTLVTDNRDNAFLHMIVAVAAHEVDAIEEIYLGDTKLELDANGFATNAPFQTNYVDGNGRDNGSYRFARVKAYLGTDTQAADSDLATVFSGWSSNHRLQGIAYLYVCLRWYDRVFPNGIPNISAVVRGKKVYDPRTTSTAYSNNWALCVRDYLTSSVYGLGCTASELDDATVIASANASDEDVAILSGGTQKRYTMDGVVDTSTAPVNVLDSMATAGAGVITYSQGKFQVYAAAYATPTVTIDESWLRGDITVQTKVPRKERFNAVKGTYVEPTKLWQPTDFPAITSSTYQAQDNGEQVFRDLELPFTIDPERCQRLAKLYLEQSRRSVTVALPCNLKALQLKVWDTVMVTLALYGWSSKPFRVTAWRISSDGGVDLELKEDDSNVYAWSAGNAATYPAIPSTNLPNPAYCAAPGAPAIVEETYTTTDGTGVKVRVNVSWTESTGPFVWRYRLEYKKTTETDYRLAVETSSTSARLEDVEPSQYHFRVKAINTVLAESDYSPVTTATLLGLTAPPADVSGLTLNELKGNAHLQWGQAVDADVRIGGSVRVRHSPVTTGATWSAGIDLVDKLPGVATQAVVPLVSGTYMLKFVDSTGNESVNATTITSTLADILAMNVVVTQAEQSGFTGTKVGMVENGGVLQLDTGETSGTYDFALTGGASIDLKQTLRCRLVATVGAVVYRSDNLWDAATGLWDDASGTFDGEDVTGVNVELYVRTTQDDPAATPTWSDWRRFVIGDYEARAFQFQVRVTSDDEAKNVDISTLEVKADVPDRDERITNQALSGTSTSVTFATPFYTKPSVVPVIQSPSAGDNVQITAWATSGGKYTGFTAVAYNGSGTVVSRTVDFYARGY